MSTSSSRIADRVTAFASVMMFVLFLGMLWIVSAPMRAATPDTEAPGVHVITHDPVLPDEMPVTGIIDDPLPSSGSEPEPTVEQPRSRYIEIVDSCGPYYEGACVNVRSGPGTTFPSVTQLRNGVVLKIAETVVTDDREWHRIVFDEWLRYPERVHGAWYVAADFVRVFEDVGIQELTPGTTNTKRIIVDRSEQMLYAYEDDELIMQARVSTGIEFTPTPRGTFTIFRKTPTRYMQGPLPGISDKYYDLPGVPWNLYFTAQGAVVHGAYWHDHFGAPWSNGCVNLPVATAEELYRWADIGTTVVVRD